MPKNYEFSVTDNITTVIINDEDTGENVGFTTSEPAIVNWVGNDGYQIVSVGLAFKHSEIASITINDVPVDPIPQYGNKGAEALQQCFPIVGSVVVASDANITSTVVRNSTVEILPTTSFVYVDTPVVLTTPIAENKYGTGAIFGLKVSNVDGGFEFSASLEIKMYDPILDAYTSMGNLPTLTATEGVTFAQVSQFAGGNTGNIPGQFAQQIPGQYAIVITCLAGSADVQITANYLL